jgi:beta-glucanase (GH16 family)
VLAGVSCSPSPASSSPAAAPPPWKRVWTDNFNGPAGSSPSAAVWRYDTGQGVFGTGEVETMTGSPANSHLDGHGNLDLIALGHGAAGSSAAWTSARLQTRGSGFGAPAGGEMMVTAAVRQPDAANMMGYWPGFWMLGPEMWPRDGEIDIMEDVDGLGRESGTLHCGNLTQHNADGTTGPCHEGKGLGSGLRACAQCNQAFHTYSVIVDRRHADAQQIRWYLDGHEFYSVSESRVGQAAWTAAVDHGFSILLSLAVGGSFPDEQCGCTTPTSQTASHGTMVVQYVSVYTN